MNEPMYMIANLAVGGYWPGMVNSTTPFPAQMKIDYIHAYADKGVAAPPPVVAPPPPSSGGGSTPPPTGGGSGGAVRGHGRDDTDAAARRRIDRARPHARQGCHHASGSHARSRWRRTA